ncbi:hypothetical protein ACP70R_039114 [Stipagrostis hirtigluma subsp. patula]
MADDSKVTEVSSVADGWDILSLTSSVYTSPLFRREFDPINLPGYGDMSTGHEGANPGVFMSDVFVFPPSAHENLPIEPDLDELDTNNNGTEGSSAGNNDDQCHVAPEEVDGTSDENLSVSSDLPSANETTLPDSTPQEICAEQEEHHATCKSDLSCEGWWKRKSTYLFHHIKGVTTVCSVVAAGAVVGFVVMGQRWQQDKWHLHQFHLSVSNESMGRVIGLFSRLKDGLPGTQQLRSMLPTRVLPQQQLSA